jgi:hypothetical protein
MTATTLSEVREKDAVPNVRRPHPHLSGAEGGRVAGFSAVRRGEPTDHRTRDFPFVGEKKVADDMKTLNEDTINRMFTELQNAIRCLEVKQNLEPTDFHPLLLRFETEPRAVLSERSQLIQKNAGEL